jgi:hypothetical protein
MNVQLPTLNAQHPAFNEGKTAVNARGYSGDPNTEKHGRDARATSNGGSPPSLFELWRDSLLCAAWFTRYARLAPLSPLSYALRASARRDAISVLPPHLDSAKRIPQLSGAV